MRKTYIHPQIDKEEIRLTSIIATSLLDESADSNREALAKECPCFDDWDLEDW